MDFYRPRDNLLGDIINASPLFVGKPGFKYTENNYQTFVSTKASRTAVVLAAANDGMLHAFDRVTGDELWAYIPSFVMPNLYKLADRAYANNHSYFVDGSPQMGDIYVGGAWKTIVVGGLNAGGRGYYALDVTDPANPKQMWEFRNDNLGLTFGNPIITKRQDGTWVVVFASGYNNVGPGDGNGHLFVLNADTGALVTQVDTFTAGTTGAGNTTTPSGLSKINSWVDSELVNQSKRFYGGDLLGNLWRFDIDAQVAPFNSALRLAQLTSTDGTPQPVTSKPALAEVSHNGSRYPVVFVATGKYMGTTDLADNRVQSIYAIKDPLVDAAYGVLRSNSNFVAQTITASGTGRTSTNSAVDWLTKAGWRADLPAGERVSVNPQLALETMFVGSNLPSNDSCTVGGQSFLYEFNIGTGGSTSTYVGNVMIQGLTLVQLTTGSASGSVVSIITRSDGTLQSLVGSPSTTTNTLKRTSWRELVD
jgi:type IV pilus assembly protein PilY1